MRAVTTPVPSSNASASTHRLLLEMAGRRSAAQDRSSGVMLSTPSNTESHQTYHTPQKIGLASAHTVTAAPAVAERRPLPADTTSSQSNRATPSCRAPVPNRRCSSAALSHATPWLMAPYAMESDHG